MDFAKTCLQGRDRYGLRCRRRLRRVLDIGLFRFLSYLRRKSLTMELDSSVNLSVDKELNMTSVLGPEDFAAKVLSVMPKDVKSGDLGCGRILADYSVFMQTRYVLCDIYEDGTETSEEGKTSYKYRIEIKSGKKTSRIGDAVYCFLFIVIFWFLSRWTTQGFNPLFLIISGLAVLAALYLIWTSTRSKFGPKESAAIAEVLKDSLSCTPR